MNLVRPRLVPAALAAVLVGAVAAVTVGTPAVWDEAAGIESPVTPLIGEIFFDEFLAVFQMIAILLVAALVAAVYLAKPDEEKREALKRAVGEKPRQDTSDAEESMGDDTEVDG